jgi:hypothetical protein
MRVVGLCIYSSPGSGNNSSFWELGLKAFATNDIRVFLRPLLTGGRIIYMDFYHHTTPQTISDKYVCPMSVSNRVPNA